MKLDELLALPKSGVIILKKQGKVLVTYTTSMAAYLETLYQEFGGKKDMEMEVVSEGADLETLKLHTEYYRSYYQDKGQLLQYHVKRAIKYKVRVVPSEGFKYVGVEIVNMRGDGLLVGLFKNAGEAKDFIETYYGVDNPLCFPVYASNSDTKEFLKKKTKLLDIK